MTGSPLIAQWVAHLVFWAFLGLAVFTESLRARSVGVFVALWALGYWGLPRLGDFGGLFITPYVSVLDVVLVLIVFKGDIRLT